MSDKRRGIVRKCIKMAAWSCGVAALIVFLLSALVYYWNNQKKLEHISAPAGKMFCPDRKGCHFAVLGDVVVNTALFSTVYDAALKEEPEFVLLLGDIVPRHDQQIVNVSSRQMKKVLQDKMVCPIPGNHDVAAKGEDCDHLRHYRTLFGSGSYFFTYGDTLFYALDNSRLTFSDEDFAQMRDTLSLLRPLYRNFVFYMHAPPETACPGFNRKMMNEKDSLKLEALLKEFQVTVTFCGHLHQYVETRYADAPLYVVRASGQGDFDWGYLDVRIADGNVVVRDVIVPWHGRRMTLFPDWEEFKLIQVCTSGAFLLIGGALLLISLGSAVALKFIEE